MSRLPIDSIQQQVIDLAQHNNLVVEAETGSGKSTRLPLWLSKTNRLLVVQPRRIACLSLSSFLSEQLEQSVGEDIGYAIKLEQKFKPTTKAVFVTPGVALRWFAENRLSDFDLVILDEFHERRWDNELLLALLRRETRLRLIVTSATLNGQQIASYLCAKQVQAEGRNFPVNVKYTALESHHLPDGRGLDNKINQAVLSVLQSNDSVHDILVFLPGRKEISACLSRLSQSLSNTDLGVKVVCLHSSVSDSERDIALNQQPFRKIVLATNVAETSLTIPNISHVIDSGLERRNEQRNGLTTLTLSHISRASAEQRAGRAGRVMAGTCIRLFGQHAALSTATEPELLRENLAEPMLLAAACGSRLDSLEFLESLPEKSMAQARNTLLSLNAISESGKITPHGEKLYPLPVDMVWADLINRMESKKDKEAMIDLAASLSVGGQIFQLSQSETAIEQLEQSESLGCDASLLIRLVRGDAIAGVKTESTLLAEAKGLSQQMRSLFELPDLSVTSRYERSSLLNSIIRTNPELVFVRRERRQEALSNGVIEVKLGRNSRLRNSAQACIVFGVHSLPGRGSKQTLNLTRYTAPIELSWLSDAELGEWQTVSENVESDLAVRTEQLIYANRVIATKREQIAQDFSSVITQEIINGHLWPGYFANLVEEVRLWNLYVDFEQCGDKVDSKLWLESQMTDLDINSLEEFDLFSPSDLLFEGIPEWEKQDFVEKYPAQVVLSDLTMNVEYSVKAKCIQLIHESGQRKVPPKRWELPAWSGWRIQYRKASRVVDIK